MLPVRRSGISRNALLATVAAAAALIAGCGDVKDDRPVKWSFISATIVEPSCATVNCHSAIAQRAGVDLHDRASGYNSLTTGHWVNPVDPMGTSALHYLMKGQGSLRMPPDSPLPDSDIQLIENWIKAGALND